MIKVNNLVKTYPGKVPTKALRGVSFEVKEGSFSFIMGKSGSGKSTLLHSLGLLDQPTRGEIYIDGANVANLDENQKNEFRLEKLGYVFQEYALLPELTALENVYLPLIASKKNGKNSYKEKAAEVLIRVGLENRLDHYPNELSGGEQQRVSIARALANNPKIVFADEPCANLDSESSNSILSLFSELNKKYNQTILMVSHEPEDVKWANQVIWIKDGLVDRIDNKRRKKNEKTKK